MVKIIKKNNYKLLLNDNIFQGGLNRIDLYFSNYNIRKTTCKGKTVENNTNTDDKVIFDLNKSLQILKIEAKNNSIIKKQKIIRYVL